MLNLLDEVVDEVFRLMLGSSCSPVPRAGKTQNDLTALISFSGALDGECALSLDRETAATLTLDLLGEDDEALWPDTVGELCNMIAGTWKSRLAGERSACKLSVPLVTEGPVTRVARIFAATTERFYRADSGSLTLVLSVN